MFMSYFKALVYLIVYFVPILSVNILKNVADKHQEKEASFSLELSRRMPPTELSKAPYQDDMWLYMHFFQGVRNGVVVEVGAGDGSIGSYSSLFEKFANFTSVHVESDHGAHTRLKLMRPHAINLEATVCDETKFVHVGQSLRRRSRGILEYMPLNFLQKNYPDLAAHPEKIQQEPKTMCKPLMDIFRPIDLTHVNLLLLDINGAETAAIKGIMHSAFAADVISTACTTTHASFRGSSGRDSRHIFAALEPHGYTCFRSRPGRCVCSNDEFRSSALYRNASTATQAIVNRLKVK